MSAVVTGGAGFIGSHLIEALVARGDEVVCVERPGAPRRWLEGLDLSYRDSGLDNERALSAAFAGADVVFHLAGLTEARAPRDFYAVNTEGTARVFRAAAAHNGRAPRRGADRRLMGPGSEPRPRGGPRARAARGRGRRAGHPPHVLRRVPRAGDLARIRAGRGSGTRAPAAAPQRARARRLGRRRRGG